MSAPENPYEPPKAALVSTRRRPPTLAMAFCGLSAFASLASSLGFAAYLSMSMGRGAPRRIGDPSVFTHFGVSPFASSVAGLWLLAAVGGLSGLAVGAWRRGWWSAAWGLTAATALLWCALLSLVTLTILR